MTCDDARELLHDALDDRLDAAARAALSAHVAGCAECASEQAELAELRRAFRAVPGVRAPQGFTSGVMGRLPAGRVRRLPLWVAPLAAVAAVVLVMLHVRPASDVEPAADRFAVTEAEETSVRGRTPQRRLQHDGPEQWDGGAYAETGDQGGTDLEEDAGAAAAISKLEAPTKTGRAMPRPEAKRPETPSSAESRQPSDPTLGPPSAPGSPTAPVRDAASDADHSEPADRGGASGPGVASKDASAADKHPSTKDTAVAFGDSRADEKRPGTDRGAPESVWVAFASWDEVRAFADAAEDAVRLRRTTGAAGSRSFAERARDERNDDEDDDADDAGDAGASGREALGGGGAAAASPAKETSGAQAVAAALGRRVVARLLDDDPDRSGKKEAAPALRSATLFDRDPSSADDEPLTAAELQDALRSEQQRRRSGSGEATKTEQDGPKADPPAPSAPASKPDVAREKGASKQVADGRWWTRRSARRTVRVPLADGSVLELHVVVAPGEPTPTPPPTQPAEGR